MRTGIIANGCVINPGCRQPGASVVVQGDTVVQVVAAGGALPGADWIYDAVGRYVVPGFIDIHTHGAAGYDITDESPEAVSAVARAKLAEGVTRFCPTTLTLSEKRLAATMRRIAAYREDARFSQVVGVHLEGPFINPSCLGAQNPAHVRPPDLAEVLRLHAISPVTQVTFAVEMDGGVAFAAALREHGIIPACGHSRCGCKQFQKAYAAGLRHLAHYCNQMSPLHHRDIGLVGAGLLYPDVTLELICDTVHVCPEMLALIFAHKPRESLLLITDSIRASHLPDGPSSLGGLDVVVRDGEARLVQTGALAGSTLRMNVALRQAARISGLPLEAVIGMTAHNQANELGLASRFGRLAPGCAADAVVLDPETCDVEAVYVDGEQRFPLTGTGVNRSMPPRA